MFVYQCSKLILKIYFAAMDFLPGDVRQGKELGVPIEVYILIIRQAFSMKSRLLPTAQIVALKRAFDGHRELEKLIDQMRAILLIPLAACVLFAVVVDPATGAVIELPAIVVTGRATKPPDIVDRTAPSGHRTFIGPGT